MNSLNDSVSGISKQINSGQSLQATQLVGKNVLIPAATWSWYQPVTAPPV